MNDLIRKQDVLDAIKEWRIIYDEDTDLIDMIKQLPSAQSEQECEKCIFKPFKQFQPERKNGEWIIDKDCEGKSRTVTCNLCGHKEFNWHDPNFCPNCGADMRGEENETD